jgi:hypothetical protein
VGPGIGPRLLRVRLEEHVRPGDGIEDVIMDGVAGAGIDADHVAVRIRRAQLQAPKDIVVDLRLAALDIDGAFVGAVIGVADQLVFE